MESEITKKYLESWVKIFCFRKITRIVENYSDTMYKRIWLKEPGFFFFIIKQFLHGKKVHKAMQFYRWKTRFS